MKVSIWENGSAGFHKEVVHPNYTNERSGRDLGDDFEGRWWGIKVVQILFSNKCRIELWADTGADDGNGRLVLSGNQNRWRMIGRTEDTRGVVGRQWRQQRLRLHCRYFMLFKKETMHLRFLRLLSLS
jgi:hypothetical protein